MTSEVYYTKKDGEYIPVSYYDSDIMDGFPKGSHLVVVKDGSVSRRYNIDPTFAPTIAAFEYSKNAICAAIIKASEAKPAGRPITPKQAAAFDALKQAYGSDMYYIQYPSVNEAVSAGVEVLQLEIEKLLKNPAVKKAYDNFMLLAKLAYENNEL